MNPARPAAAYDRGSFEMNLTLAFCGRTYHIGQLAVPVMGINEDAQLVCLKVGETYVWVPAASLAGLK